MGVEGTGRQGRFTEIQVYELWPHILRSRTPSLSAELGAIRCAMDSVNYAGRWIRVSIMAKQTVLEHSVED